MNDLTISQACEQAADLILRDGFIAGGPGWTGGKGWCIEGALAHVYGIQTIGIMPSIFSAQVNLSPAGRAIREHLCLHVGYPLYQWNDVQMFHPQPSNGVVRVLKEVAAKYNSPYEIAGQALDKMAEEARALKVAMDEAFTKVEAGFVKVGEAKPVTNLVLSSSNQKLYVSNGEKFVPDEAQVLIKSSA